MKRVELALWQPLWRGVVSFHGGGRIACSMRHHGAGAVSDLLLHAYVRTRWLLALRIACLLACI